MSAISLANTVAMLCRFRMTPSNDPILASIAQYPISVPFEPQSCVLLKHGNHSLRQHFTWREENQRLQVGILGFINAKLTDSTDKVLQSCHCVNDPLHPFTRHLLYKPHNLPHYSQINIISIGNLQPTCHHANGDCECVWQLYTTVSLW